VLRACLDELAVTSMSLHASETGIIQRLLTDSTARLIDAGVSGARLDAEVMLAAAVGVTRAQVIAGAVEIDERVQGRYAVMIARRVGREPVAYIVGRKEFYSIEFEVSPAALIPRPETETLVTAALEFIAARPSSRVIDLGAGSGAIALAIAAHAPGARLVATDIAADALGVAQANARRLVLVDRVEFRRANCFDPLDDRGELGRFDLIVSNPPYIPEAEIARLAPEIARFEPRIALAGGPDGMDFYRKLAREATRHLLPGGAIAVETGSGQAVAVAQMMRAADAATVTTLDDLAGIPRVVRANFS
jgi:release factor glutamine methyltransferase